VWVIASLTRVAGRAAPSGWASSSPRRGSRRPPGPVRKAPGPSPFPRVDRPVAPIITPAYSDEATRDRHGEAERVMKRLGVGPGLRVADVGAGDG